MRHVLPTSYAERAWECDCLAELTRIPEMAEQMRRLAALYREMASVELVRKRRVSLRFAIAS